MPIIGFIGDLPPLDDMASEATSLAVAAALCAAFGARTVVEAGTYKGHFAVAVARTCPEVTLYTCDPVAHVAAWPEDVKDRIVFVAADFEELLAYVPGEIDFAYIDASGDEEGAAMRWRHLQAVLPRVRKGGLVMVDDTRASDWPRVEDIRALGRVQCVHGRGFTLIQT